MISRAPDHLERKKIPTVVGDDVVGFRLQRASDHDVVLEVGRYLVEVLVVAGDNEGYVAKPRGEREPILLRNGRQVLYKVPREEQGAYQLLEKRLRGDKLESSLPQGG